MQVCQLENYGVPVWSASPLTKNLLASGTWTGSQVESQSFLRISSYDINKGMSKDWIVLTSFQIPSG
jgi:hypothetical protein